MIQKASDRAKETRTIVTIGNANVNPGRSTTMSPGSRPNLSPGKKRPSSHTMPPTAVRLSPAMTMTLPVCSKPLPSRVKPALAVRVTLLTMMTTRDFLAMLALGLSVASGAQSSYDLKSHDPVGQVREYVVEYGTADRGSKSFMQLRLQNQVVSTGDQGQTKIQVRILGGRVVMNGQEIPLALPKSGEAQFGQQRLAASESAQGGIDRLGVLTTYNPPQRPVDIGDEWVIETGPTENSGGRPVIQEYRLDQVVDSPYGPVAVVRWSSHEKTDKSPASASGVFHVLVRTGVTLSIEGTAQHVYFMGAYRDIKFDGRLTADMSTLTGSGK